MPVVIKELADDQKGGYAPRGAAKDLWQSKAHEVIISGPAETGKSWACMHKLDALMWKYPGAQATLLRKTYASMPGSVIRTYLRVIGGKDSPIKAYGGEKPQWFDYPNGSRIWIGGMDNPGKSLSSERDFIVGNQLEEFELNDWETLTTRCTGRGAVAPYTQMFGDCNPGAPNHWIKHRTALKLLESRHEDNPTLFDDEGNILEQGRISLSVLDDLTGVRKERLRYGRWASAEGVIYDEWDPHEGFHLINRHELDLSWDRYWTVDFGFNHPFSWQQWCVDPDGRLILELQIYRTQRLVEDHAKDILAATEGYPKPKAIICDHDAEDRATLERHIGIPTIAAKKTVRDGIQAVKARLKVLADGKPRLMLMRDSLVYEDVSLKEKRKPTCLEQEIEVYVWDNSTNHKTNHKTNEEPVKEFDHGCDGMRYMVAHLDLAKHGWGQDPNSLNELLKNAGIKQKAA